jgi:hypothetical protein
MIARFALPAQLGLCGAGMLALTLAPPASGRLLLIPVTPAAADGLAALVIARGGRLTGAGPIEGSLVVDGDRAVLTAGFAARGVLVLSAAVADCGRGA